LRAIEGVPRLSEVQVERALKTLAGWKRDGDYITKEFRFRTFPAGIRFVDAVALVAEAQGHHPDIHVVWTTVTLKVQTHDEGGITALDFELAKAVEKLVSRGRKPRKSTRGPR
jgi:4a-hydroxytetrahydrobiopterin dehydratase